jgi:hypothetical protein
MKCYHCSKEVKLSSEKVFRSDVCPHCMSDLHSCRNCGFYDPSAQWECREHISELVKDKEKANFCDSFRIATTAGERAYEKNPLLEAAEKLFKKS